MQFLTITYMAVIIEDFDHVTTMDESLKWMKLTHLLLVFLSNP
jgi:hypothetical protein